MSVCLCLHISVHVEVNLFAISIFRIRECDCASSQPPCDIISEQYNFFYWSEQTHPRWITRPYGLSSPFTFFPTSLLICGRDCPPYSATKQLWNTLSRNCRRCSP